MVGCSRHRAVTLQKLFEACKSHEQSSHSNGDGPGPRCAGNMRTLAKLVKEIETKMSEIDPHDLCLIYHIILERKVCPMAMSIFDGGELCSILPRIVLLVSQTTSFEVHYSSGMSVDESVAGRASNEPIISTVISTVCTFLSKLCDPCYRNLAFADLCRILEDLGDLSSSVPPPAFPCVLPVFRSCAAHCKKKNFPIEADGTSYTVSVDSPLQLFLLRKGVFGILRELLVTSSTTLSYKLTPFFSQCNHYSISKILHDILCAVPTSSPNTTAAELNIFTVNMDVVDAALDLVKSLFSLSPSSYSSLIVPISSLLKDHIINLTDKTAPKSVSFQVIVSLFASQHCRRADGGSNAEGGDRSQDQSYKTLLECAAILGDTNRPLIKIDNSKPLIRSILTTCEFSLFHLFLSS